VPGPGESRPDPTEGITRVDDLPKPNISIRSRDYRRRPGPRCGRSSYRDGRGRRTLHDLGDTLTGRPRDIVVLHSRHSCTRCRRSFNADMTDLADPGSRASRGSLPMAPRWTPSRSPLSSATSPTRSAPFTSFVRPSRQPSRESKANELFEHRHLFVRRRLSPSEPGDAAVDHPRTAAVPYTP